MSNIQSEPSQVQSEQENAIDHQSPYIKIIQQATDFHEKGNFDEAEALYLSILEDDPKQVDVLQLLGILYGQVGDYKNSETCLNQALMLKPSVSIYVNLANVFKCMGEFKKAVACYEKALNKEPTNPSALNNLGALYYYFDQLDKAKGCYKKALYYRKDYADAHYNIGLLYCKEENRVAAKRHFKKSLALEPDSKQTHSQLGQIYHYENNLSQAIIHYKKSLDSCYENPDIHHKLAAALTNHGQMEEAIEHFLITLKQDPTYPHVHQHLGVVYLSLEQYPQALRQFMAQIALHPTAEAYSNLGTIYMRKNKQSEAISYFNEALALDRDYLNAWINLGAAYLQMGDSKEAVRHYQSALELDPNNLELAYIIKAINNDKDHAFTKSPKAYVKNLFDRYASYFDQHLLEVLNYSAPQLLYDAVIACLKDRAYASSEDCGPSLFDIESYRGFILDIGCGTGLCGPLFRPLAKTLWGVDLSQNMLDKAAEKSVYDRLICDDIIGMLEQMEEHKHAIDLVLAADVLPYFGDLSPLFKAIFKVLKPGGYFAFTIETARFKVSPYTLERSARFSHSQAIVAQLAKEIGFTIISKQASVSTRLQKNKPVSSQLYVLESVEP